ncbi:ImmA/IrrE family metallo-endopeptidase [Cellulosimicrobium funkei]|uniref:ImmA/IrrE family metallo-endopeptidase n=1 Tax=Cellulosimicrobium funkei TaxID=264251 RepID=UPI003428B33F
MSAEVDVAPAILDWAVARGDTPMSEVRRKHPAFDRWRTGAALPTLPQLEAFARTTNTPVGFLLLDEPPEESVPMADFRVRAGGRAIRKSANLLDQVYLCERRQAWYADYAADMGYDPVALVASMSTQTPIEDAATRIRHDLGIKQGFARRLQDQGDMVSALAQRAEDLGVLVMISGVQGYNTRRKLDPEEFSGFSLADRLAPLIFINGADTKRAQAFTLVHELAHLYLGVSALSHVEPDDFDVHGHEEWCNKVAAFVLVDERELRAAMPTVGPFPEQLEFLWREFKVSTLVLLRRMLEVGILTRDQFFPAYAEEVERLRSLPKRATKGGGDFKNTAPVRASKRFTRAILRSTFEGGTLYRDAFAMLGTHKTSSLRALADYMGIGG